MCWLWNDTFDSCDARMRTKSFENKWFVWFKGNFDFFKKIIKSKIIPVLTKTFIGEMLEKRWFKLQSCRYLWVQDVEKAATQKSDYLARLEKENGEAQANLRAIKDQ